MSTRELQIARELPFNSILDIQRRLRRLLSGTGLIRFQFYFRYSMKIKVRLTEEHKNFFQFYFRYSIKNNVVIITSSELEYTFNSILDILIYLDLNALNEVISFNSILDILMTPSNLLVSGSKPTTFQFYFRYS